MSLSDSTDDDLKSRDNAKVQNNVRMPVNADCRSLINNRGMTVLKVLQAHVFVNDPIDRRELV